ncbi:MAG: hypothetical protein WCZ90_10405 [Melioribacteraceae bacterium]
MNGLLAMLTMLLFGLIGFNLKSFSKPNPSIGRFVVLLLILPIVTYVGVDTKLISIFEHSVYINNCLQGLVLGAIARMIFNFLKIKNAIQ